MNYELETDYCEPETCHQLKTNEKCVVFFFFYFFFFKDAVKPLSKKRLLAHYRPGQFVAVESLHNQKQKLLFG